MLEAKFGGDPLKATPRHKKNLIIDVVLVWLLVK